MLRKLSEESKSAIISESKWENVSKHSNAIGLWKLITKTHLGGGGASSSTNIIPGETKRLLNQRLNGIMQYLSEPLSLYLERFRSALSSFTQAKVDPPDAACVRNFHCQPQRAKIWSLQDSSKEHQCCRLRRLDPFPFKIWSLHGLLYRGGRGGRGVRNHGASNRGGRGPRSRSFTKLNLKLCLSLLLVLLLNPSGLCQIVGHDAQLSTAAEGKADAINWKKETKSSQTCEGGIGIISTCRTK